MSEVALLSTAVLLGLFVLAGGAYGLIYSAGQLRSSVPLQRIALGCYTGQLLIALLVCISSPLSAIWKAFVVGSALAYAFIPPLMWRLLESLHRQPTRDL